MSFTVAIIGRPNVGKSTLFNRLAGRRLAIVHDRPGVTRDRREAPGRLFDIQFTIMDTAGLEEAFDDSVEARMRQQTEKALEMADVALMLIDARAGVTPLDKHFADRMRRLKTKVLLVANKCEGKAGAPGLYEAYGLGLGEPIPISAEHGEGLGELYDALLPLAVEHGGLVRDEEDEPEEVFEAAEDRAEANAFDDQEAAQAAEDADDRPIQVAVVGRPNVGKSTLVNRLLGEDRMLTGPEAGLTRDAITVEWNFQGRRFKLVDTAGLRKRAQITDAVEKLSVANTIEAIKMAQVVTLVLDADMILDKQDLTIARLAIDEGRGLVIAINKWDQVQDKQGALQRLNDRLEASFSQVKGIPTVTISAIQGRGVDRLMEQVIATYKVWTKRISTGHLNRWLHGVLEHHPPPAVAGGRRIKIRYMTQAKSRPPTFIIFVSRPEELPESYLRYLANSMRETFDLPGVPLRIWMRKGKNPYE